LARASVADTVNVVITLRKGIVPASYSLQRLVRRSSMVRRYSSCGQAPHRAGFGSEWPLENSARMREKRSIALEPSVARSQRVARSRYSNVVSHLGDLSMALRAHE